MVLADYPSYVSRQTEVGQAWRDREHWTRMSHPQRRTHGQVLLRPVHSRLL